jgi:hypothetical protein
MVNRSLTRLFARLCLLLSLTLTVHSSLAVSSICALAGASTAEVQAARHSPCAHHHSYCACAQIHAQFITSLPPAAVSLPAIQVKFDAPLAPLAAGVRSAPLRPPIARSA